jgi:Tfp pilus assembly PilM family ATPase
VAPFTVEDMRECPQGDAAALEEAIRVIQPKKSPSGYLHATVGVFPAKRLVRRHSLEMKRIKEAGYLAEICTQQFRIEQDKFSLAILNAVDGSDYDFTKVAQKDVMFCGLPGEEVVTQQNLLLESGIYPERLELGSVAMLGGVVDCLGFSKSKTPTLVLEIGADATHSFIVSATGVDASRPIPQGLDAMVPIVQKELGLKDEESARKLFYSNTFDFTGMGPLLIKRLLKELQSSIGFYEVQTGQSVGQVLCTQLSPKLAWLDAAIAGALGISSLKLDPAPWLQSRHITLPEALAKNAQDIRWFGLLSLMAHYHSAPAHAAVPEEKT